MHINWAYEDNNGVEHIIEIPAMWAICENCDGEGKHMQNDMRSHAYTPEEFYEEFDDEEQVDMYFNGGFDVACDECRRRGKIIVVNVEVFAAQKPELYAIWEQERRGEAASEREHEAERRAERYLSGDY